ncbi:MAG: hypothetical protein GX236_06870, partial [Clostridiaceae bacterium]|nr:hypothetical protein [Clostridiaceae bacterium]
MQTAIVASDRLGEIFDLSLEREENENKKIQPVDLKGDIVIKNVDFRYCNRAITLCLLTSNLLKP